MSASKEKKNRQDLGTMGAGDPRTAREAQQRKEEKRSNRMYAAIAILFVIVAIATLVWKSNLIPKTATAVSINGENYKVAEVNFYYKNVYQSVIGTYYNYLSYLGLDPNTSMKDQTVNSIAASMLASQGAKEGQTWYDFMMSVATDQMCAVRAMTDAAEAEGFSWTDEMQTELDSELEKMEKSATSYGYSMKQYIALVYGNTMTQSTLENQLKSSILAQAYSDRFEEGLVYTTDDLEKAYTENPGKYDVVDYQYVVVSGAVPTTDSDGNTVEVTDEMKAEAMDTAKKNADAIYAAYQGGEDLSTAAEAYDSAAYYAPTGSANSGTSLSDWLFDEARKAGDSTVLEDESTSNYYVVVFGDRYRYDYATVDVRHILVTIDSSNLDSASETYEADLQAKKDEAKAKAEELLNQWKAGEATEESFAELANENSADGGSNTNGGLYEQVAKGTMVQEFNDWCFDASRKPGDTGIVYGESDSYAGYHVMYFSGTNLPYWQVQVTSALKNNDYTTWYDGMKADYSAELHSFGMKFVG